MRTPAPRPHRLAAAVRALRAPLLLCVLVPAWTARAECDAFSMFLSAPRASVGGDFDGTRVLTSSEEVLLVPRLDDALGFAVGIGSQGPRGGFVWEYMRTGHEARFLGARGRAVYEVMGFDVRIGIGRTLPVQPFALLGWLPWGRLTVRDGSASADGRVGDARFLLILRGFEVGGGVFARVLPRVWLDAAARYRLAPLTTAAGVRNRYQSIEKSLSAGGAVLSAGVAIALGRGSEAPPRGRSGRR